MPLPLESVAEAPVPEAAIAVNVTVALPTGLP